MLKSIGIVCDQDEDNRATNATLEPALINFNLWEIYLTLQYLAGQRERISDLFGRDEHIEHTPDDLQHVHYP